MCENFMLCQKKMPIKLLEGIAKINGLTKNLKLYAPTKSEEEDSEIASEVQAESKERRSPFSFFACGINIGEQVFYKHDPTVVCTVVGDRMIEYNGEQTSVSALAQKLQGLNHPVQGTLHFTYQGETLSDLRARLESEGKYYKNLNNNF